MIFEELKEYEGIGEKIARNIIEERNKSYFKDLDDLSQRVKYLPRSLVYEF